MSRLRSEKEINELVALARTYCELRAKLACALSAGGIDPADAMTRETLNRLSEKIELLKSNNEFDRNRARANNILQMPVRAKRAAK